MAGRKLIDEQSAEAKPEHVAEFVVRLGFEREGALGLKLFPEASYLLAAGARHDSAQRGACLSRNATKQRSLRSKGSPWKGYAMTSAGVFLAGVGTTILLIGAGFGGGLMLARTAMEPTAAASSPSAAGRLPPARVILPASAEAASPPQPPSATVPAAAEPSPRLVQTKEVQQSPETGRAAERAERRKADEQERRKRVTERKAKRDAARNAKQQHERQQAPGILAFGGDNEHPPAGGGFFGN